MKGQLCVRGGIYHVLSLGWKFGIYSKALLKKGLTVEINLIRRNSCQLPNKGMFSLHWLLSLQGGLFQIASCACMCFQTPSAELALGAREAWNAIGVCIHLFPGDAGPWSFGHHENTDLDPNIPISQVTGVQYSSWILNAGKLLGPGVTYPQDISFSLLLASENTALYKNHYFPPSMVSVIVKMPKTLSFPCEGCLAFLVLQLYTRQDTLEMPTTDESF